jgi:hypothetical protein
VEESPIGIPMGDSHGRTFGDAEEYHFQDYSISKIFFINLKVKPIDYEPKYKTTPERSR